MIVFLGHIEIGHNYLLAVSVSREKNTFHPPSNYPEIFSTNLEVVIFVLPTMSASGSLSGAEGYFSDEI